MDFTDYPAEFRDRYRPVRLIGEGGMGRVYLAQDSALDRPVAVKFLHPHLTTETSRERMGREARAMATLSHAGLVRILNAELSGQHPLIVMEWVEGESLTQALTRGRFSIKDATRIIIHLLSILAYLHDNDILHRDLKPSNVLLKSDLNPVLIDFGLAAKSGEQRLTETGVCVGTSRYFAPELFRGEDASVSSDLFALGLVGLEMLAPVDVHALTVRVEKDDIRRIGSSLLSGAYFAEAQATLSPFGPPGKILLRSLEPNAAHRFTSAAEMRAALVQASERSRSEGNRPAPASRGRARVPDETRVLPPEDPGARSMGPGSRLRLAIGALALLLCAALCSHTYFTSQSERPVRGDRFTYSSGPSIPAPDAVRPLEFQALGMNKSILVDFRLVPPLGATVVLRRGGRIVEQEHFPTGCDVIRRVFRSLSHESDYLIDVTPDRGRGGVHGFPVRTLSQARSALLSQSVNALSTANTGSLNELIPTISATPDLDSIPGVMAACRSREASVFFWSKELSRLAAELRSPELARLLLGAIRDYSNSRARHLVLRAALSARIPEAVGEARLSLFSQYLPRVMTGIVALSAKYSATLFRFVIRRFNFRGADHGELRRALVRMDRHRARDLFREWAAVEHRKGEWRTWNGMAGLAENDTMEDRQLLLDHLLKDQAAMNRGLAALALARLSGTEIAAALTSALERERENIGIIAANTLAHNATSKPILLDALAKTVDPRVQALLISSLGAFGEAAIASRCRQLLETGGPELRRLAAWALGKVRDETAVDQLAELVSSGKDEGGTAAWALSHMRTPRSFDVLSAAASRYLAAGGKMPFRDLGHLALALGNLGDPRALSVLKHIFDAARNDAFCRECASSARTRLLQPANACCHLMISGPLVHFTTATVRIGDIMQTRRLQSATPDALTAPSPSAKVLQPAIFLHGRQFPIEGGHRTEVALEEGEVRVIPCSEFEIDLVDDKTPFICEGFAWLAIDVKGKPAYP
jgi:serine/threonine protein kinase